MYESPLHLLAVDGYSAKLLRSARHAMGRRSYYQIREAINKQTNKQTYIWLHDTDKYTPSAGTLRYFGS